MFRKWLAEKLYPEAVGLYHTNGWREGYEEGYADGYETHQRAMADSKPKRKYTKKAVQPVKSNVVKLPKKRKPKADK